MATVKRFRTASLQIEGQLVRVNVKRLTLDESEAHRAFLRQLMNRDTDHEPLAPEDAAQVRTAIETYLSVPPGELSVDEEPVVTGAQLLDVIGEYPGLVLRAMLAIANSAVPTRDEGKPSASESVSVPSSDAPDPAPDGLRPAPTAESAERVATAPAEDATAATASPSSGPMGILN